MNALLIANGEPPSSNLLHKLLAKHDRLIAVDGGFNTCLQLGVDPDLIMGDFDSLAPDVGHHHPKIPQILLKDQTKSDLEKSIHYLLQEGFEKLTVCGALGKRIDHTLANIYLLARYVGQVTFESDDETCFALPPRAKVACHPGQTLSLIPLSTRVTEVVTQGLKWELSGQDLTKNFISLSNLCQIHEVDIQFQTGDLLLSLGRLQ